MRCKLVFQALCLCLSVLFSPIVLSETAPVYVLDKNSVPVGFGLHTMFIEDIKGEMSLSDVQEIDKWSPTPEGGLTAGFTKSAYWLRFAVNNSTDHLINWNLEFAYPLLDKIDFYSPSKKNSYVKLVTGDHLPFSHREINYRNIIVPIKAPPLQENIYYVRIKTVSSMNVPLKAWPANTLYQEIDLLKLILGIFYGVILLASIIALVNAFLLKEVMYLWLCLSFLGITMYLSGVKGITFQYFWPNSIWWATVSIPFFVNLGYIPTLQYCREFTNIKQLGPIFDKVCIGFLIINAVGTIASLVLSYEIMIRFCTVSATTMGLLCLIAGIYSWKQGNSSARLYVFAWTIWLLASITFALTALGVFPRSFLMNWSQEFGFFCFVVLMTIAQFDRFLQIQREQEKNQSHALDALSKAEEEYRTLFENAIEGIFQLNEQGILNNANKTFSDITNIAEFEELRPEEMLPFSLCFLSDMDAENLKNQLNSEDMVTDFISNFTNGNNETVWLSITIQKIIDIVDESISYKGAIADITETKKRENAEKQSRMAEASTQAKDLFLANMSHEIRTPMNSIIDFTHKASEANKDENIELFLLKIKRASANLLSTINDILDFSKIEAGKLQIEASPFNIHHLMDNVFHIVAEKVEEKGLRLNIEIDEDIPDILIGDLSRLQQILSNLSTNAVKHTDKGDINISLELVSLNKKAGDITITGRVSDSGKGISAIDQEYIFSSHTDENVNSSNVGSGFGLSITKQLLELMGGNINVNSVIGQGSIFVFQFTCRIESRKRERNFDTNIEIVEKEAVITNTENYSATPEKNKIDENGAILEQVEIEPEEEISCLSEGTETDSSQHINQTDGLERCQGNEKLYLKLFADFIKNYGKATDDMRTLLSQSKLVPITKLAHTFKGLAGNLGATMLASKAMTLEQITQMSELDQLTALDNFELELKAVVLEMQQSIDASTKHEETDEDNLEKYPLNELDEKIAVLKGMVQEQKMDAYDEAILYSKKWPISEHAHIFLSLIDCLDLFDFEQASQHLQNLEAKI